MAPETREMLLMKYYSNMFRDVYFNLAALKGYRNPKRSQERQFQAAREQKKDYIKGKHRY